MKHVTLDMLQRTVAVPTQARLLDTLVSEKVEVMQACGGRGICATCHVQVLRGMDKLTPMTDREKRTLARITGVTPNSRLACQSRVLADGVELAMPDATYAESIGDIEALIGKRCKKPILHPVDGRVLIQKRKIITRSAISALRDVTFDISDVQYESI